LDDLLSKLRNIATILMRGQGGEKELIFDEWDDRIWEARLSSGMQPDIRGFGATMTLEFLCPNPNSKAAALSSGSFNLAGDTAGGAINTGNTETDTTWTIKNGASEAAGGISIYNETRGELFVWDNVLTANAWLKIDSSDMNAWVSTDSGGTWTLSNANSTGVAPKLDAGLNAITVYGCVSGEADFEYYERNK
jgi:phage-related protein